ncbi:cyclin-A2-3 isoform X2 [Rhodamnia argentea]|uniref:Cyclin-A2-3 isoform X2 n=1 Tax=Rhodamnia argentea TaxID=178133 RepID=A0A8B8NTV3_9MYRT|nr:cyclin-A2-3 isoform X2 [Rhodamnia argentea]
MKKETLGTSTVGAVNGRVTRARGAAIHASEEIIVSESFRQSKQHDQNHASQEKPKRAISDGNGSAAKNAFAKRSKQTALQDVTNVCCNSLHKDCFNVTKIVARNGKKAGNAPVKVSKVIKSVSVEVLKPQSDLSAKTITEMVAKEPSSATVLQTIEQEEDASSWSSSAGCTITNSQLEKDFSGMSSQNQEKESLQEISTISEKPQVTNIDSDQKDPLLCSLYAPDIYSNLRVTELLRRPCCNFMDTVQKDITQSMRGILVDWLVEVSEEYKLYPDTLYLAVFLIDRFLSQNYIERRRLQLLGITCMLIASKYEEICAPRVEDFCFITDNTYTREEVLKMEGQLLKYFGFCIFAPTAKTFLRRFIRAAQALYTSPSLELEYLADYLAELTLVEYDFLSFLPSLVAASAVFLARWTLDDSRHPWNPTLEFYTSYKASDLKTTVSALQGLQLNAKECPLSAIRIKYRQQKFKSVALLPSTKTHEALF